MKREEEKRVEKKLVMTLWGYIGREAAQWNYSDRSED